MRTMNKVFVLPFLLMPLLASASPAPTGIDREISAMGTRLTLHIDASERSAALSASESAIRAIEQAERRLSTWKQDTELSRVNQAKPGSRLALSPKLARDLEGAFRCSKITEGSFDPAIGPLVAAWDLRGQGRIPSSSEIAEAKADSDPAWFELSSGTIVKKKEQAVLEEGAWGKGVGLDDAARELKAARISDATLNFGGQVLLMGARASEVAIADPER